LFGEGEGGGGAEKLMGKKKKTLGGGGEKGIFKPNPLDVTKKKRGPMSSKAAP